MEKILSPEQFNKDIPLIEQIKTLEDKYKEVEAKQLLLDRNILIK